MSRQALNKWYCAAPLPWLRGARRLCNGFTLVEMAIVMLIVGLLLGGLLAPLSAQIDQQRNIETQKLLAEIKEALIGFAVANGRLPCPAISAASGAEKTDCTTLAADRQGYIPWAALGVAKLDSWGHIFSYSVTPAYATAGGIVLSPATTRDITIRTRDATGIAANLSNAGDIPVVILSHGQNGYGSTDGGGVAQAVAPATNIDETSNATSGTSFYSRTPTPVGYSQANGGEFDDIVVWISPNILFSRMVAAGRLP